LDIFEPTAGRRPTRAIYAAYLAKLCDFVCWLLDRQYAVTFLPGEVNFDAVAIAAVRRLVAERRASKTGDVIIENDIQTVSDLLTHLARLDLVCASRFHTILLSQLAGIPGLALSYRAKIDSLMKNTGQDKYCLPIGSFSLETLKTRFLELDANPAASLQMVARCAEHYRTAHDQQYARIFN